MIIHNLLIYMIAVLALNLFPGPDMIYIIGQSVMRGKLFGISAALGIAAGCFVHIFAVTVGLAAFIFKSAFAFSIIKYLGAAYLIYIGLTSLFKKQATLFDQIKTTEAASWKKSFRQGFLTNALNPKVALFFLAFLPQFIVPSLNHSISLQMLILGLIFNLSSTTVNILIALFFGTIKNWLMQHPQVLKIQEKVTGLILIGLGLRLALAKRI